MATSDLRSCLSSALASSISFFASSAALSNTCEISSRLLIASTETGSASLCFVSGMTFSSEDGTDCANSGWSPRSERSSWSSSR